jgi:hypothetical protein
MPPKIITHTVKLAMNWLIPAVGKPWILRKEGIDLIHEYYGLALS